MRDPTRPASGSGRQQQKAGVRRALTSIPNAASRDAVKAVQPSRSAPLPQSQSASSPSSAAFVFSSPSSVTSDMQFPSSLSGAEREQMEELQYLLDGCSPSSPQAIRHASAVRLLRSFLRSAAEDGSHQFFLMRAHGGFSHLCRSFADCGASGDAVMCDVFASCLLLMSRDNRANAQGLTAQGLQAMLDILSNRQSTAAAAAEAKAEVKEEQKVSDAAPLKLRSLRRPKPVETHSADVRLLFASDPFLARSGFAFSPSLLSLLSLSSFSSDSSFKTTIARIPAACSDLVSAAYAEFCSLLQLASSASPAAASSSSPSFSLHLFRLQSLLVTLENLTHSHRDNQCRLLDAGVRLLDTAASPLPYAVTSFAELYFAMLQWFTARVLDRQDAGQQEAVRWEDDAEDEEGGGQQLQSAPSDAGIVLLLCRLLVNLTNKSDRGCQSLYHSYPHPTLALALPASSSPSQRQQRTGVQIIADIVGVCWYNPQLRAVDEQAAAASPASSPGLNFDSELLDLLTLAIGIMINTAEQSAVIREVLLEDCNISITTRCSNTQPRPSPSPSPSPSAPPARAEERMRVSWLQCLVDIFVLSYTALHRIAMVAEQQQQTSPAAAAQRYGSGAASAPTAAAAADGGSSGRPSSSAVSSAASLSLEHASLVHRMLCSYAGMIVAILAVHDSQSFHRVQAALRGRKENQHVSHHRQQTSQPLAAIGQDALYDPSPPLSSQTVEDETAAAAAAARAGQAAEQQQPSPQSSQLIFSLRLVARLLNDFLLLHESSAMSEDSMDSMAQLIAKLERRIRADSSFL